MAKTRIKKTVKTKGVLLLLLVMILTGLSVGFVVTEKNKPASEPETQALAEPPTEPPTEAPAEPPTEPPTEPESTTKEPPVTLPKSADGSPVIVSPTGDNWELTLLNLNYCLPEGYVPTLTVAIEGSQVQLDERVAPFYAEMYAAAKADGCTLTPYSGYRSYARQEEKFKRRVSYYVGQGLTEADAKLKTQERILPPGCSEHNAGFAMDVVSASADFVSTKEFSWLCEHAQDYGFILRYPEDKTAVTGVMYEPWHWRYVGVKAAKEMKASGQCLEEYLGLA